MPDGLFHVSFGYLIYNKLCKKKEYISIFVFGNILPDLFTRALDILLIPFRLSKGWFFFTFHTPIGIILLSYIISFVFEEKLRNKVFYSLVLGSFSHFLLDSFQESFYHNRDFLLFPFSFRTFSLNIFYYNDTVYISILILVIMIKYLIRKLFFKKSL